MLASRSRVSRRAMAAALVAVAFFLFLLRDVLLPFVFAGAVAYLMSPWITAVQQRWNLPRWPVALTAYLVLVAVLGGTAWWTGVKVYASFRQITTDAPQRLHQLLVTLFHGEQWQWLGTTFRAQDLTDRTLAKMRQFVESAEAAKWLGLGLGALVGGGLSLVLLFYFLMWGPRLAGGLLGLVPPEHRDAFQRFGARVHPVLRRYLLGLGAITCLTAGLAWIGVGPIFHLPHPLFLALATGVLELIPVIGPIASAMLLGGAAMLQGGAVWSLLGFGGFCLGLRLAIDQVLGPWVLGKAVELSPVVVIFSMLACGYLFGLVGVLLAIPAAAVGKLLLQDYYARPISRPA